MFPADLLARARRRQNWLLAAGLLPTAVIVPVMAVVILATTDDQADRQPISWFVPVLVLTPVLIAAVTVGVLFWLRHRGTKWLQPSPALGLSRPAQKRMRIALRSGQHLTGIEEAVAQDVARRILQQERLIYSLVVFLAIAAIFQLAVGNRWLAAGFAGLVVLNAVLWRTQANRARRYLGTARLRMAGGAALGDDAV